jgi:hypothetical protein
MAINSRTPGTVMLSFRAARVTDAAGNSNTASTSTDNMVTFTPQRAFSSLDGRVRKANGGLPNPSLQMWLTDTNTGEGFIAPVTPTGYYRFKNIPMWQGVDSA